MRLLSLAMLGLLSACSASLSPRCQDVCQREAQCAEERADEGAKFDQDECVAVCTALERDDEGRAQVDRHIACADEADSCERLLACE